MQTRQNLHCSCYCSSILDRQPTASGAASPKQLNTYDNKQPSPSTLAALPTFKQAVSPPSRLAMPPPPPTAAKFRPAVTHVHSRPAPPPSAEELQGSGPSLRRPVEQSLVHMTCSRHTVLGAGSATLTTNFVKTLVAHLPLCVGSLALHSQGNLKQAGSATYSLLLACQQWKACM